MKVKIKNLGILKQAEFSIGDITILCGENNTGKSYATYAFFGFLSSWRRAISFDFNSQIIEALLQDGIVTVNLESYISDIYKLTESLFKGYNNMLPEIFAAPIEHFSETDFFMEFDISTDLINRRYEKEVNSITNEVFLIVKEANSKNMTISLFVKPEYRIDVPREIIRRVIDSSLKNILLEPFFPNPFIASVERTGTAIFRKELNFSRNRLLEELAQSSQDINPFDLLLKGYDDYALPVKKNVEFTRNIEFISKRKSWLAYQYPELLSYFKGIIGGDYQVTTNDELYYRPKNKRLNLSMDESSSSVRALLDIGFYLKHMAQPNDIFIIDEPELNLHPENQRKIARLFARLANIGIKVFITTQGDYIIKELNTLIMLNQDSPYLKKLAEDEGYLPEELLSADKVKAYVAEKAWIKVEGNKRKTKEYTLTPAQITQESGIEITSFDRTIDTMNRIQDAILWRDE